MRPIAIRRISFFETSVAKQVDRCDDHHYDEQRQQCVEYRVGKFMQPTPPWQLARLVCCLETVLQSPDREWRFGPTAIQTNSKQCPRCGTETLFTREFRAPIAATMIDA